MHGEARLAPVLPYSIAGVDLQRALDFDILPTFYNGLVETVRFGEARQGPSPAQLRRHWNPTGRPLKTQGFVRVCRGEAPGIQLRGRDPLRASHGIIDNLTVGYCILARFHKGFVETVRFWRKP